MKHTIETLNIDIHVKVDQEPFYFVHTWRNDVIRQYVNISHASFDRLSKVLEHNTPDFAYMCNRMITLRYRKG